MMKYFSNIKKELSQVDTGVYQMVKFGFIVGGILLLLTALALYHGKIMVAYWVGIPGAVLFVLGATIPSLLKPLYLFWMALAFVLGSIVGAIILATLYYIFVTPIALLVLLFKGNPLEHRTKEGSYWIPRVGTWNKDSMERLF